MTGAVVRAEAAWTDLNERVLILRLDDLTEPPLLLEGPAAAIWRAIDGQRDLDEVCVVVADGFDTTPDQIAEDVVRFVADMNGRGLLCAPGGAGPSA